jgi:drug/metabolite transporter (DMT)-like permease
MAAIDRPRARPTGESAGFLASLAFMALASVRDVYFGGLFQSTDPLAIAVVAFALCALVFLPIALVRSPESFRLLTRRPGQLLAINVTTALAWIAFFHALRTSEPLLVQILFSGVGPLSVSWLDRFGVLTRPEPLGRTERALHLGLLGSLVLAAAVVVGGRSGMGAQPTGTAWLGVGLAVGAGLSISLSTVLSRRLSDVGVRPTALVSVRFVGAVVLAAGLAYVSGAGLSLGGSTQEVAVAVAAVLALIVAPIYVNQVGTALASPLTVRAVLALGPVAIFVLQLLEGRLTPSPWSLACALVYGPLAVSAAVARRRSSVTGEAWPGRPRVVCCGRDAAASMRSVSMSVSTVRGSRKVEV